MIQFHCQHCGNYMRIGEEFAGRDACCKACKRYIIIPKADGTVLDVLALPIEERLSRTEQLLQFTTEKNQQFRVLLAPYRDVDGRLTPPAQLRADADRLSAAGLQELGQLRQQCQDWRREKNELEQQQAIVEEQTRAAGLSLVDSEAACAGLRAELVEAQDSICVLREALSACERRTQELESGLVLLGESAQAAEAALQHDLDKHLAREQSLETELNLLRYELDRADEAAEYPRSGGEAEESRRRDDEAQLRSLEAERDEAATRAAGLVAVAEEFALALEGGALVQEGLFEDRCRAMLESLLEVLFQLETRLPAVAPDAPETSRLLALLRAWAAGVRACLMPPEDGKDSIEVRDEEMPDEELFEEGVAPEDPMAEAYMRFLGPSSGPWVGLRKEHGS